MKSTDPIDASLRSTSLLDAAMGWANRNVAVLLCWGVDNRGRCDCGRANCSSPGKHPISELFPHGHKSATTNPKIISRAVRKHPDANLAIVPTGHLIVLDVDGDQGRATFKSLKLPVTAQVLTSRGFHAYYRREGNFSEKMPKLAGIDIKTGATGYLLVPPSIHATGHEYAWSKSTRVLAALSHDDLNRHGASPTPPVKHKRLVIAHGERNSVLTSFAGYLRYRGFSDEQMLPVLTEISAAACQPPLSNAELASISRSVGKYESDHEDAFGDLDQVVEQELEWLAYPYFVRGAVNVIEGNPGDGKSTFVVALAAAVSSGSSFKFFRGLVAGRVLVLSAEDDPARVLKPRFMVHHANLKRIRFQTKPFTLDGNGLWLLRAELSSFRPCLVIIDPLIAYMDASMDMNRANVTMHFMSELDQLAREFNTTVLVVRHLRKGDSNDALYRGLGSIAIAARVRSIMLLGRDPNQPDVRALAHVKSNYAPPGPTILFDLQTTKSRQQPKVRLLGTTRDLGPDEILSRPQRDRGRPNDALEEAKAFLRDCLSDGKKTKSQIDSTREARSISEMTLRRAALDLNVVKSKQNGKAVWALPRTQPAQKFSG